MKTSMKIKLAGVEYGVIEKDQTKWANVYALFALEGEGRKGHKAEKLRCDYQTAMTLSDCPMMEDFNLDVVLEPRKLSNGNGGFAIKVVGLAAPVAARKAA